MVPHHHEKWVVPSKISGAKNGVPISLWSRLFYKDNLIKMVRDCGGESLLCPWCDDDRSGFNPTGEDFVEYESHNRFSPSIGADKGLQGQVLLCGAGCRDDRFLDLHEF
jgi:hypothetical protein